MDKRLTLQKKLTFRVQGLRAQVREGQIVNSHITEENRILKIQLELALREIEEMKEVARMIQNRSDLENKLKLVMENN